MSAPLLSRRALVLASLAACSRPKPTGEPAAPASMSLRDWTFSGDDARGGSERVVVLGPRSGGPYPVLVAIHGRGEATRGPEVGAYGWVRDYQIGSSLDALARGQLTDRDFQGLVAPPRLASLNRSLAQQPFGGLILAFPHAPDLTGPARVGAIEAFGDWVAQKLAPRLRAELPASPALGIDGVSMGGRMALRIGLARPDVFAAVGSLQAALSAAEVPEVVKLAREYRQRRAAGRIRLLTSEGDYFRGVLEATHRELDQASVAHDFDLVVGPHNYQFNQGPGAIEMLLWHDRALRQT